MNDSNLNQNVQLILKDFCIEQILECGQCFRFYKLGEKDYIIIAKNRLLNVKQVEDQLNFYCSEEEFNNVWKDYFDLDRDYSEIKKKLADKDLFLREAVTQKHGIRLLKQDPWEMLISFILSQTKQIPHIKKLIEALSIQYGDFLAEYLGVKYYTFPTPNQLMVATEEDLRALKTGFRATYIVDAVKQIIDGAIVLQELEALQYDEAKIILKSIKGVGDKIADCVLLFAYSKYEVFPTDVWVKRIVEYYYFQQTISMDKIQEFAKNYFGEYAGFAQQYLFYHARDNKLGK
ncbi:MAG: N-glycosylase [Firmicutes bacterium HGW-Firmicutes-7]|nr:MAG: N-glycosylase [Firmicutes bacterium HGW-Firmicutes-7]